MTDGMDVRFHEDARCRVAHVVNHGRAICSVCHRRYSQFWKMHRDATFWHVELPIDTVPHVLLALSMPSVEGTRSPDADYRGSSDGRRPTAIHGSLIPLDRCTQDFMHWLPSTSARTAPLYLRAYQSKLLGTLETPGGTTRGWSPFERRLWRTPETARDRVAEKTDLMALTAT